MNEIDLFYQAHWKERWSEIKTALMQDPKQVAWKNPFANNALESELLKNSIPLSNLPSCYDFSYPPLGISRSPNGLLDYYILDPGSVWIAHQLPLPEDGTLLDMCAAPGGKTLILNERRGAHTTLFANEPQLERRTKLIKNLKAYIPEDKRKSLWVKGLDGGLYSKKSPNSFRAILVDAPCSGERFLFKESPEKQKQWSPQRSKRLGQLQYSLLCSALLACQDQGYILFSTCSLSPYENDAVIEKLLKKKRDQFEIISISNIEPSMERTTYGVSILPDKFYSGPFYCCLIQRKF